MSGSATLDFSIEWDGDPSHGLGLSTPCVGKKGQFREQATTNDADALGNLIGKTVPRLHKGGLTLPHGHAAWTLCPVGWALWTICIKEKAMLHIGACLADSEAYPGGGDGRSMV
jgi:hypothetical protein